VGENKEVVENHPNILIAEDHQEWQGFAVSIARNCPPRALKRWEWRTDSQKGKRWLLPW